MEFVYDLVHLYTLSAWFMTGASVHHLGLVYECFQQIERHGEYIVVIDRSRSHEL